MELLTGIVTALLTGGPVTIDLDATDVEVYGSKLRGAAYNHQGSGLGVRTWPSGPRPRPCWRSE